MSWSLGEIRALVVKAARGAGHPWGVADEVGLAVDWLEQCGLPGAEAAAQWLQPQTGACPVTLGLTIADSGDLDQLPSDGAVAMPLLLLPFLGRAAPERAALSLKIGAQAVLVWSDGTDLDGPLPTSAVVSFAGMAEKADQHPGVFRVQNIAAANLTTLNDFAARTYAPATEASRLLGAGAGLTDND